MPNLFDIRVQSWFVKQDGHAVRLHRFTCEPRADLFDISNFADGPGHTVSEYYVGEIYVRQRLDFAPAKGWILIRHEQGQWQVGPLFLLSARLADECFVYQFETVRTAYWPFPLAAPVLRNEPMPDPIFPVEPEPEPQVIEEDVSTDTLRELLGAAGDGIAVSFDAEGGWRSLN